MNEQDELRLRHMLSYAQEVMQFTQGRNQSELETDMLLERALRYSIGIIGEAASHISQELRDETSDIPWADIVGMRNFLFHAYFRIDAPILWRTATESVPHLAEQIRDLLKRDN
jgi:uncharacterized protein with HEPN domain